MGEQKPSIVLLSGGRDSATTLAIARHDGYNPYAMSFRYGQWHNTELEATSRVAKSLGVARHVVLAIDLRQFGGSALTADLDAPKRRSVEAMSAGIPVTYVPARNTVFLSFALTWVEVLGSTVIFIGVNAVDYSGYPDRRAEFVEAFQRTANLATRMGVEGSRHLTIHTPLIHLTKAEIIRRGDRAGHRLRAHAELLRPFSRRRGLWDM